MAQDKIQRRSSPGVRSMSARLARSLTGSRVRTNPVLDPVLSIHRQFHPKADAVTLTHAYERAEELHQGVYRKDRKSVV